jgi:hypothetical protein
MTRQTPSLSQQLELGALIAQAFAELGRPHEHVDPLVLAWAAFLRGDHADVATQLAKVDGLSTDLADKLEAALTKLGVDLA